jgi:RNA polymerase sigma factor (sigma-70 family)
VEHATAEQLSDVFADLAPRLRAALTPLGGREEVDDAVAEAFAYLCANSERVLAMSNPAGYLYRVGRTHLRRNRRRPLRLPAVPERVVAQVEPGLPAALAELSEKQRVAVFLVAGVGWRPGEVADYLGISESSVRNHYERGLTKLRRRLGEVIA